MSVATPAPGAVPGPPPPAADPFLTALYDALHDSPQQRRFRRLAPMPFGVVLLPYPGMTEAALRQHFRTMRRLGFTAIKQFVPTPEWSVSRLRHVALDEGVVPWWYGDGGWEEVTDALLERLGIPARTPMADVRVDPRMIAYQTGVLRGRIDAAGDGGPVVELTGHKAAWEGVPHSVGPDLDASYHPHFLAWVREQYESVAALVEAWNLRHVGILPDGAVLPVTWDDVASLFPRLGTNEYRHLRDVLRFKADNMVRHVRRRTAAALAADPHEPVRAGGEMGLFLPFAWRGTDMEAIAEEMVAGGSFYPSIHLAWHFEEVDFEIARPLYMQASLAVDWFKGGWSASWESTGGPQQFSGGKGLDRASADAVPGFTVDEGVMTQLLLTHLAAGFRGVGLWCWNARTAGWEAGEYALLDRNNRVSPRAVRAGQIAQAAQRLRDELWQARKEPLVGVFQDWENEAVWACMSVPNRDRYRHEPIRARVGVSRALINGNVPWEHVTAADLRKGLAGRYRVIYMPAVLAVAADVLDILHAYVRGGGRLVMDMPGAWFDSYGRVLPTGPGSAFERLFGGTLDDFQFASRQQPAPRRTNAGLDLTGFRVDLTPTTAAVTVLDGTGRPLVLENRVGHGQAVLIGYAAALSCFRPGRPDHEAELVRVALGPNRPPFTCSGVIAYRLASPAADHYFLVNDGPPTHATLVVPPGWCAGAADAVTGDAVSVQHPIFVEGHGARWLRCERSSYRAGRRT